MVGILSAGLIWEHAKSIPPVSGVPVGLDRLAIPEAQLRDLDGNTYVQAPDGTYLRQMTWDQRQYLHLVQSYPDGSTTGQSYNQGVKLIDWLAQLTRESQALGTVLGYTEFGVRQVLICLYVLIFLSATRRVG